MRKIFIYLFVPRHTMVTEYSGFWCRVLWFLVGRPCFRLSYVRPSVFSFPDEKLSKYQWIFTKIGMCIGI